MEVQFKHQYKSGNMTEVSESEINRVLKDYDPFQTWGYVGDLTQEDSELNMFYLVPKKLLIPNTFGLKGEIDYRELSSVITKEKEAWFCCEFFFSDDEFKRTKYRSTFKIKISKENKLILDWIVKRRSLLILKGNPPTFVTKDIFSLLKYFETNPGIILPLRDVTGLALHDDYIKLLNQTS